MRGTSPEGYNIGATVKYKSQRPLRFFQPGPNAASSINLFLRRPTPFIFVLGRLGRTVKPRSEGRDLDGSSYLRQELPTLSNLSVQRGEECRLVLGFCQHLVDFRP